MHFWNSYPFVRLSIALILGISSFDLNPQPWHYSFEVASIGILLFIASAYISRRLGYYKLRHINGFLALMIISWLGGVIAKVQYHELPNAHYLKLNYKIGGFSGIVVSSVNERPNHNRYILKLTQVVTNDSLILADGEIHFYVRKDSISQPLKYGDKVNVFGSFFEIKKPGNPAEFDYKKYLTRQNIYSHAFVKNSDVEVVTRGRINPILHWSYNLREQANKIIDACITQPRENGIAKALLLGIKDDLDNDLKKAYAAAGAMHVLAVSGLHVGIIYLIIKIAFGWLKQQGIWGKYFFGAISVFIIWLYACVTGLSPSVLRAATMFTMVAIGDAAIRESNIYNSLGIAAFILLCLDPYLIYSVGFQLSFAAVLGIVYLQPVMYQMIHFRYSLIDKAWAISCVSLAAQIATFPLTAFYFHQFPTYFLISNLVVIPASFLMLTGGILLLVIGALSLNIALNWAHLFEKFIWIINEIISAFHSLPHSLIEWIYIDKVSLILIYAIMLTTIVSIHFGAFRTLVLAGILINIQCFWFWKSHKHQSEKEEIIVYDMDGKLAMDYIKGHQAILYLDTLSKAEHESLQYQIDPYRLQSHLRPAHENLTFLKSSFNSSNAVLYGSIANQRFFIFDSTTFHLDFVQKIETDYIIINNGAVKSLQWLQKQFTFKQIIISNKNSFYYSNKMKRQAAEYELEIHSIPVDGALRITLN